MSKEQLKVPERTYRQFYRSTISARKSVSSSSRELVSHSLDRVDWQRVKEQFDMESTLKVNEMVETASQADVVTSTPMRSVDTEKRAELLSPTFSKLIFDELNSRIASLSTSTLEADRFSRTFSDVSSGNEESSGDDASTNSSLSSSASPSLPRQLASSSKQLHQQQMREPLKLDMDILPRNQGQFRAFTNAEFLVATENPSSLFWVPAHQHPEIAPAEYQKLLESRSKKIPHSPISAQTGFFQESASPVNSDKSTDEDSAPSPSPPPPIEKEIGEKERNNAIATRRISIVRRRRISDGAVAASDMLDSAGSRSLKRSKRTKTRRKQQDKLSGDEESPKSVHSEPFSQMPEIRLGNEKKAQVIAVQDDPSVDKSRNAEIVTETRKEIKVPQRISSITSDPETPRNSLSRGYSSENDMDSIQHNKRSSGILNMVKSLLSKGKLLTSFHQSKTTPQRENEPEDEDQLKQTLYTMSHNKLSTARPLVQQVLISNMIFYIIQLDEEKLSPAMKRHLQIESVHDSNETAPAENKNGKLLPDLKTRKSSLSERERQVIAKKRERSQKGKRRKPRLTQSSTSSNNTLSPGQSIQQSISKADALKSNAAAGYLKNLYRNHPDSEEEDFVVERRRAKKDSDDEEDETRYKSKTPSDEEDEKPLALIFSPPASPNPQKN